MIERNQEDLWCTFVAGRCSDQRVTSINLKGRQVEKQELLVGVSRRSWNRGVVMACVALVALVLSAFPLRAVAQTGSTGLRGLVVDTTTMRPVVDAFVYLLGVRATAHTDPTGEFVLYDVRPGTHTLLIRRRGFVPRQFRFSMGQHGVDEIDLGVITLQPGEIPTTAVYGRVSSMLGGSIGSASVLVNGRVAAVTDSSGFFRTERVGEGFNLIETRRIGYVPGVFEVELEAEQVELDMSVSLYPVPVQLEEINVSAQRTVYVAGRLREFYDRRNSGLGRYLARWEIEAIAPLSVSDLLQRFPAVQVIQSSFGRISLQIVRGRVGACNPSIYLDGVPIQVDADFNINSFVIPQVLEGVEVYTGPSEAPVQYLGNSTCGVILLWTQ